MYTNSSICFDILTYIYIQCNCGLQITNVFKVFKALRKGEKVRAKNNRTKKQSLMCHAILMLNILCLLSEKKSLRQELSLRFFSCYVNGNNVTCFKLSCF